ncbi:MAG: lipopolysaccharide kinase InaA family protein [Bacteroidales bacterium]
MKEFSSIINTSRENDLIINKDFKNYLYDHHINSFDSIWQIQDGQTIKDIKHRSVVRLDVSKNNNCILYIKKHKLQFIGLRGVIKKCLGIEEFSQGYLEFKNICDFRKNKLSTAIPVAAGEKFHCFFWVKSFLITQDFFPYVSLESLLDQHPEFINGSDSNNTKYNLIENIALLARKMHKSRFHHRDFNATHILLNYNNKSVNPHLALFDLQRVERRGLLRFRWMTKCLARLNYTLPENIFNSQDRLRLLLSYRGKRTINLIDRLLWLLIHIKTQRIKRHTEKKYNKA